MQDVYSQEVFERNSIVELPEGFEKRSGEILYSWLGSLWRNIHLGNDMIEGLQKSRGIRLAQLYLDILEAAMLKDRNGMPVFHRELWHPIVIKASERDKSQENMLRIGMDAEIGPQPEGSEYGRGTVLKMGKIANMEKFVTYPIGGDVVEMASSIVDNIINPSVSMESGVDFVLRDGSIVFPRENDPLGKNSPFEKYDVPTDDPEHPDIECVLWASDVLIDRNYIADHLSYALGADAPSNDVVKRILNAAWSSVTSGLTPELIKTLMAAMLNIPVVQNRRETVLEIYSETDGSGVESAKVVRTDAHRYRLSPKARLIRGLYSGAVLKRGDLLDESLRVYPILNNVKTKIGFGLNGHLDYGSSSSGSASYVLPAECFPIQYVKDDQSAEFRLGKDDVVYMYYEGYDYDSYPYRYVEQVRIHRAVDEYGNRLTPEEYEYAVVAKFDAHTLRFVEAGSDASVLYDPVVTFGGIAPEQDLWPYLVEEPDPSGSSSHYSSSSSSSSSSYQSSSSPSDQSPSCSSDSGSDESSSSSHHDDGYDDRTGFSIPLEQDIPSIVIPSDILRVRTKYGLYAMWGFSTVRKAGDGNPEHLYFDVGGDEEDVSAFWNDVWDSAEKSGVKMSRLIGREHSKISPAEFFLRNLVGANTMFIVVDSGQIDDSSLMHDPMFFGMLSSVVPSGIRLFIVEHRSVHDERGLESVEDGAFLSAALPKVTESMSLGDCVGARFVRPSPPKTKGRKEEE